MKFKLIKNVDIRIFFKWFIFQGCHAALIDRADDYLQNVIGLPLTVLVFLQVTYRYDTNYTVSKKCQLLNLQ